VTPSDLLSLALPGDPQPPVAGRVFYVLATQDGDADEKCAAIWSVRPGESPVKFSSGKRDRSPRVSPDGSKLAFVGERGDGIRLYIAPLDGGEATAIGPSFDRIDGICWSPDSRALCYAATTPLDPETAIVAFDERSGARHIRALPFKSDDDGLLDGRRRHLFTLACDGGEPMQLTQGDFDVLDPVWSTQGDRIAFSARKDIPEAKFFDDIYVIATSGVALTKLTQSRGPADKPSFSHDGTEVAYLGHEHGDDAGGRFNTELFIVPADGGETRSVSTTVDRPVMDYIGCDTRGVGGQQAPFWSADDRELFVSLSSEGTCGIAAFLRDGSGHRTIANGERDIFAFSRAHDGTIVFSFSDPVVPCEIGLLDTSGLEQVLTKSNPWLEDRPIRAPRRVRPVATDGTVLDLWILDPDEAENAPYVLQVHGGPHTAYGFAFMLEFQILRAHGIGVAYGNPRGSQTYGHAYADAIVGNWGGLDASDVLTFLDALLENAPADPARIGLAGGSYGGFMTTWLLGHCKRFAAGVSMRAVNDFVSEVGATDLGWFLEGEVGAPWDDGGRKLFEKSPMRAAHEIDVPLLVEHSERDYRCAIDQGEQLFTLLRRLGRAQTEFVRFTGDGHNLSRGGKPRNRILRLRSIVHWFVRYLKPAGFEPAADVAGSLFAPLSTESSG
jgi:dipeptidyl aminopeptidase/acylaminoacyl peptidase